MRTNLFDLTGRVAIVTGSTKGIGRAMVEGLAAAGATVVVSSRKQDICDQVAAEVEQATGSTAVGMACHVGDWDAVATFVADVQTRLGRIDVLVNNAGINPARIGAVDMTLEFWRKVFAVNVEGPLRTGQLVAPIMREQGGGSIINIASMAGYSGGASICAYASSKAALINLTKSQAQEWATWRVRVNAAGPGAIHERNDGGWREDGSRLHRHGGLRDAPKACGRAIGDYRAGPVSGQRRLVVCYWRRDLSQRGHAEVAECSCSTETRRRSRTGPAPPIGS